MRKNWASFELHQVKIITYVKLVQFFACINFASPPPPFYCTSTLLCSKHFVLQIYVTAPSELREKPDETYSTQLDFTESFVVVATLLHYVYYCTALPYYLMTMFYMH